MSATGQGILLEWPTHEAASGTIYELHIKELNMVNSALGKQLEDLLDKVEQSECFRTFTIRFAKANTSAEPFIEIADACVPTIYEKYCKEQIAGALCGNKHCHFFVLKDADKTWKKLFTLVRETVQVTINKYSLPASTYIAYPDISTVCTAKMGENRSEILYLAIDGKIIIDNISSSSHCK